jgi:hypothetical protein
LKVLLDHNIPIQLQPLLTSHEVFTARQLAWDVLRNGILLKTAEDSGFEGLITGDQSIFYQQNNFKRKIALVVLSTNDWSVIKAHIPMVQEAVSRAQTGSYERVELPARRARKWR